MTTVTKKPLVIIGDGCIIHPHTTIGLPGFGIERDENGKIVDFPHIGGVRIGNNVRIGAHCNIHRGTLDDTIINSDVRIDALVHVGHNAEIGEGTLIVAHSTIGGSCKIGKNCYLGEGARIKDHVTIGNQVIVGIGAVVTKNVPNRDIVGGVPAKSIKDKCNISDRERFSMVGY